jgi:hypothetical protein
MVTSSGVKPEILYYGQNNRLQKIIIRMINNIRSRTSTSFYFKEMDILKLPDIHTLVVGLFMFKYKTNNLPNIFKHFLRENNEFHSYPTRGANRLRPPKTKTKIAQNWDYSLEQSGK